MPHHNKRALPPLFSPPALRPLAALFAVFASIRCRSQSDLGGCDVRRLLVEKCTGHEDHRHRADRARGAQHRADSTDPHPCLPQEPAKKKFKLTPQKKERMQSQLRSFAGGERKTCFSGPVCPFSTNRTAPEGTKRTQREPPTTEETPAAEEESMGAAADFHAKEFNQADVPNTEQTSPTHPRLTEEPTK